MARLRDLPHALRVTGPIKFGINVWREVGRDDLYTLAAALAYAWLFAIFPFLIFVVTLFAYIPEQGKINAKNMIANTVNQVMAHQGAETLIKTLDEVFDQPQTGLLSIGIVITIWVASGGMAMTMSALDAAFDAPEIRPFYKQRPMAMLLTVIFTVLIIAVFLLLPVGNGITHWLEIQKSVPAAVLWPLSLARYVLAVLLLFLVLAMLYKFGTSVPQKFSLVSPGAVFTVIVWVLLGSVFRFYIDKFGRYQKTYGAIGGVTIILLFFYIDALVLLIGAEINSEVDHAMKPKTT